MGIQVKQVAHVYVFANDIDETKSFYKDVLGLDVVFNSLRDGKIFGFYLDVGGRSYVEVFQKPEAEHTETNQINHLCLEVENIDDAIEHIQGRGVDITDKKCGCDDTHQAWVRDPNGVKIELFEDTDKSAQLIGGDRVAHW